MVKLKYGFTVLAWFICLITIGVWFLSRFNPVYNPAGITGTATRMNMIASTAFLLGIVAVLVFSGYKGYTSVRTAALIFFLAPLVIMIIPLGIVISMAIAVLYQGLSFGVPGLEQFGFGFMFVMPVIALLAYWVGEVMRESWGAHVRTGVERTSNQETGGASLKIGESEIWQLLIIKVMLTGAVMYVLSCSIPFVPWYNPGEWMMIWLFIFAGEVLVSIILFVADLFAKVLSGLTRWMMLFPVVFGMAVYGLMPMEMNLGFSPFVVYLLVGTVSVGSIVRDLRRISRDLN